MNPPTGGLCELQPWDTEFFGFRIARVSGDSLNPEQAAQIDAWSRSHRIRALYFLARGDAPATIQTAEHSGFGLVDIRLTFECTKMNSRNPPRSPLPAGTHIRPVQPGDISELQALARAGHRETRFFSDSHFPRQRSEDLYSTWINLDAQGRAQKVFVAASTTSRPLGYLTCHWNSATEEGQIGLVGVSPEMRGHGIGTNLLGASLDWFSAQGARRVTVVTQGNNRAAQRLYEQGGFLINDLQLWFHKWYPVADQQP
jgi:dTDP-4-amino-4,6-dideoxy-D-galactose acyltransferase